VARPVHQVVEYFAAAPVRVSAMLRLPLIGLIGVLVWIWEVDHWLPELYAVILGVYAVAALLWLVAVLRGPVPRWGIGRRRPSTLPVASREVTPSSSPVR
jgi:two-component system, NarL family, sensor kinase